MDEKQQQESNPNSPEVVEAMKVLIAITLRSTMQGKNLTEQLQFDGDSSRPQATFEQELEWLRMFIRCLKEDKEYQALLKIDRYLRILLGDDIFPTLKWIQRIIDNVNAVSEEEKQKPVTLNGLMKILSANPSKEGWLDIIGTSLDLLFEQRYGYPQGTTKNMTAEQMCLALEHAMEHDDRLKPSVWKITE